MRVPFGCVALGSLFWLGLLFVRTPAYAGPVGLQERIERELGNPGSGFTEESLDILRSRHVVFIGGMFNELDRVHWYFKDNMSELQKLGISYSYLAYPSYR